MNNQLRLYFAGARHPSDWAVYREACFAHTSREAKLLMWRRGEFIQDECDWNYMELRVTRQREHDNMAAERGIAEPCIASSTFKRLFGWQCEGDSQCQHCMLYEFDGEFPVCEHCEQCTECGHADDCPEREEPSHG